MADTFDKHSTQIPTAALWLGATGALPFIASAIGAHVLDEVAAEIAKRALFIYGAVIVSFLGGVQWGLCISEGQDLPRRLPISVIPSLIAWVGLLMTPDLTPYFLIAAFVFVFLFDFLADKSGQAPAWYIRLRVPLSATVILCLIIGAFA